VSANNHKTMNPYKITEPTCISFSGGRTSAYMLYKVLEAHDGKLPNEAVCCFANTGKEDEATLKFIHDCETHWNVPIVWLEYTKEKSEVCTFETASRNGEPFQRLIEHYKKLPNPAQRWCTGVLKIRTIHRYLRSLGWDHDESDNADFVGIRYDEPRRAAKMDKQKMPLYADKVTKDTINEFWAQQPFKLELAVHRGEALLGNCDMCFLKSLDKKMNILRQYPNKADWWAQMEQLVTDLSPDDHRTGNLFRTDHPSYSRMEYYSRSQIDMFDEETIACFCGD